MMESVLVVAALIEDGGGIFLARRKSGGNAGGLWELPGGKAEVGETPEEALAREIEEELDLGIRIIGKARSYNQVLGGKAFNFLVFPVKLEEGAARLSAHDECRCFGKDDLPWGRLAPFDEEPLRDWLAGCFLMDS